ncbi:ATP-dependent Clp protease ATP-binding subunit [Cochleicola gelatinilyticus]|uniref:AAA family ATPase n=1 Tax=Cochleicola gelatinilyticus TaxID=1763537 RepID=A0A167HKV0_9FLAO|nr:ATP-dependent Clp protease ATP-binding subunit [Cochleicola gelatinilyticus]OAB78718.1 AAA family ATPase [Cochleicola gelatinilyticus]
MGDYTLSEKVKQVIHISQAIAREYAHPEYSSAHLLKALLHKDIGMLKYLESIDQDAYYVEEWAEVRLEALPKTSKIPESPAGDDSVEAVFFEADNIKLKLGDDDVTEHSLLIALCTPGVGFSFEQLKTFPLTPKELLEKLGGGKQPATGARASVPSMGESDGKATGTTTLQKYCIDKTAEAHAETLLRISGRDSEIKMITEILGRLYKSNVLILGDPGVGKTVMLNALSYATISDNIPAHLKEARVFELDFISLVSGAGYKGEIEDRFQKVFTEIKQFSKPILLIDELKNLTDKNAGNQGLVNILKSELMKGAITIIATATNDAFRKHIETDEALSRQFEIVRLLEPNEKDALRMIKNTVEHYTGHHELDIDDETISEAIRLAKRYNKERSLPDSAVDLIDRTMSAAKFMVETSQPEITTFKKNLDDLKKEKREEHLVLSEQSWMYSQLKDKLSYLLFTELGEEDHFENVTTSKEGFTTLKKVLSGLEKVAKKEKKNVNKNDIAATIANKTGIPTGKLQADEKEKLLNMEDQLRKRVIGQDHAIATITEAVLESRSGLSKPGLPIGSFFFSGPTGTGKTELAKALAEFLFQTETSIIRFDMSEFKEEHSAALLYGAPPGYVGYEEGGLLVNKIRQKPYSIVLFDEIEKAHPSVFDIFLQILDEGKLHDRLGKEGDFSNAVILFTSNIGSQHIVDSFAKKKIPKSSDLLEMMGNHFRPEFLGRLTEIIPFSPITEEHIVKIFNIQLKDLLKALDKQEISLKLSEKATKHLAKKGFTPKYGARPLRGVIRSDLRSPLSKMIISGKVVKGADISVDIDKKNELKWKIT